MLNWIDIRRLVPKSKVITQLVERGKVESLLLLKDKVMFGDLSEEIWPARTKTDLSLRRMRLLDMVLYYKSFSRGEDLVEVLTSMKRGFDLIFVTNLVVATATFGINWFRRWVWLGAFDGDLAHFIGVTKKVQDLGKTVGILDVDWINYIECSGLTGYRNPPFEGFDVLEEAKKLAAGGEPHNYFGHTWDNLCREFLPMKYHRAKHMPFKDWVAKGDWITSGASSVGRLLIRDPDGKVKSVKARKNMVADVVDLVQLAQDALDFRGQENSTVIKSELGKIRLAVAGDIYTYLKMTWITELLGGAYYDWPGNTSEEDFVSQSKRLSRMLELCSKMFGLPYDYAGFDHQPNTDELVSIVKILCKQARLNVPECFTTEFDYIADSVVSGFHLATLRVRHDDEVTTLPVTGGLMSGLRWTSTVGNAWNSVVTGLALKLLTAWGISVVDIERFIRGDDSAIFVPNYATGAAMNVAYDAIGAKGGAGKFSLQYHKMEFLRVWFTDRCRGYPSRAIPGLTQRKPWASEPWSEDMVLKAQFEAIRTLRRRIDGRDRVLDDIWSTIRRIWCRNHNLPEAVCWTPIHAGGFGIEPPKVGENWEIKPPVPKANLEAGLDVTNQLPWRANKIAEYAKERYGLNLTVLAEQLAKSDLLSTLTSDNVPVVSSLVRKRWLSEIRRANCKASFTKVKIDVKPMPLNLMSYNGSNVDSLLLHLEARSPYFGSCPEIATAKVDYQRFEVKTGFRSWLRDHYPRCYEKCRFFHKSWHISEILDYLTGSLKLAPRVLHPSLVGILGREVACALKPRHRSVRCSSLWLGTAFEPELCQSTLSRQTYWW